MSGERRFIRPRLKAAFQDRFCGVLLFGSEARNQEGDDSDVDLMVLLKGPFGSAETSSRSSMPSILFS